ncbi:cupin domain-containing protein [uncultured Alsobacter sp.]|uniref:cupin domain-containing protein n=1 Tax=uncultured Alsobacter sp. TaxID=1748258 RepID=UPI0025DE0BC7|nr:cupin domain-containing protein [uncultured Alsobacter sp.]
MTFSDSEGLTAAEIVRMLDLSPHPEGGWYRETFRDPAVDANGRSRSTLIYFLLGTGDVSEWHRVDAVEVWHWYAGAPLVLTLSPDGHDAQAHHLGPFLKTGQRPQRVVPAGWWQTATSLGAWTLVGCTVAPGFDFAGFELAEPGWRPTPRRNGDPSP